MGMEIIKERFSLNSTQLKIIACTVMGIDHIGALLFPNYIFLRVIGRIAFPIFAWQLALGYTKTQNIKKYMIRLFVFALLSQIPYVLTFKEQSLNIFFTLFLGLLSIYLYGKMKEYKNGKYSTFVIVFIAIISQIINTDYGTYGILTIFFFHHYRDTFKGLVKAQIILNFLYGGITFLLVFLGGNGFLLETWIQSFSLVALFLIYLYNEQQGEKIKYLFYIFYPVHLLLLYFTYRLFW